MPNVLYVGGVSGVGKTTIVQATQKRVKFDMPSIPDLMLDYALDEGYIAKGSEAEMKLALNSVAPEKRLAARKYAYQKAVETPNAVLCAHFSISTDFGHEFAYPQEFAPMLRPLVLITAPSFRIREFRLKDDRKRSLDLNRIELDARIEEAYANSLASENGCRLYTINNIGAVEDAADTLSRIIYENQHSEKINRPVFWDYCA